MTTCHDPRPLVAGLLATTGGYITSHNINIIIYLRLAETESNQHNNHNTYVKHNTISYKYYKSLYKNHPRRPL